MEEKIVCSECDFEIEETSIFCPNCGAMFQDNILCINHENEYARGFCVICQHPFCKKCGDSIDNIFLCYKHENFEIIEGMAKVYGSQDFALIHFLVDCLEKDNFTPFIYSRKATTYSLGGVDYTLFRASGEHLDKIINEMKIMVPFDQVLDAEKTISLLNLEGAADA